MGSAYIPLPTVAKLLETAAGADFQTILRTLSSPSYVDEGLIKSDMGILNAKLLKLLRSSDDLSVWKGCHATNVMCHYNPLFLLTYVDQLFSAIYSKLSQKVDHYITTVSTNGGQTVLETLTFTLGALMELMRGKPTISRESLVPNLRAIIPTLINLCQYEPKICLPILEQLLYRHSTTFKPFITRYGTLLKNLLAERFDTLDDDTRDLLCRNFAYLHLKKLQVQHTKDEDQASNKAHPDDTWRFGLFSILIEFKPIIDICNHFLDFEQDKDFVKLIESLPNESQIDTKPDSFLPPLNIDMNQPLTLWVIWDRLRLLCCLVKAFVTSPTPFPIRIPIGSLHTVCEALLSVCRKYVPLRKEVQRDAELVVVIDGLLPKIQICGVRLWLELIKVYGKSLLMYSNSILGSIELFIPLMPKSNDIDMDQCELLRSEFLDVFKLTNFVLRDMGCQVEGADLIRKLLEIALELSEDRTTLREFGKGINTPAKTKSQKISKAANKKANQMGTLTDIYTNPEQFQLKTSLEWYNETNKFINFVLENRKLGTRHQIQIIRYTINNSLSLKRRSGQIPQSFIELLRAIVLNPGHEKTSILPIAVSLLKDNGDEMLDLFCHPRLVVSNIIQSTNKSTSGSEIEEKEEEHAASSEEIVIDVESKNQDQRKREIIAENIGGNSIHSKRFAEEAIGENEDEDKDEEGKKLGDTSMAGSQQLKRAKIEDTPRHDVKLEQKTEQDVVEKISLTTEEMVKPAIEEQTQKKSFGTNQSDAIIEDKSITEKVGSTGEMDSTSNTAPGDAGEEPENAEDGGDEDSDFEIPEINVSEDEDEE